MVVCWLADILTLYTPGIFDQVGPWGGFHPPPPARNSENIKAMIKKLKGKLVRLKLFPLRSATSADDVI